MQLADTSAHKSEAQLDQQMKHQVQGVVCFEQLLQQHVVYTG